MGNFYSRARRREYKLKRQQEAIRVADRLMGRKTYVPPDVSGFFGGQAMQMPIQYAARTATAAAHMVQMAQEKMLKKYR